MTKHTSPQKSRDVRYVAISRRVDTLMDAYLNGLIQGGHDISAEDLSAAYWAAIEQARTEGGVAS